MVHASCAKYQCEQIPKYHDQSCCFEGSTLERGTCGPFISQLSEGQTLSRSVLRSERSTFRGSSSMDPAGSSRPAPTARSWPVRLLGTWYLGGGKTQRVRRILRGTQTRQEDETEVRMAASKQAVSCKPWHFLPVHPKCLGLNFYPINNP